MLIDPNQRATTVKSGTLQKSALSAEKAKRAVRRYAEKSWKQKQWRQELFFCFPSLTD